MKYKFERMDFEAFMMLINLIFILAWNKGAYIGLPVSVISLLWDLKDKTHINCAILHICLIIMNYHFLTLT